VESIHIDYQFNGDETEWQNAIDEFVEKIDSDERLYGRFHYQVLKLGGDGRRVHIGRWDKQETLEHLQSQAFFKDFAGKIKAFAGESLSPSRGVQLAATSVLSAADRSVGS